MSNYTSEEMYPLIAKWKKSGKSQKAFCESVQIKLHVFKYWVKKRNTEGHRADSTSDFVELTIEQQSKESIANALFAEISYPSGTALRLYQPLNREDLKVLAQGLS